MGYPSETASTESIDLASTLERALDTASSALNRASIELGAVDVAVLLAGSPQVEITYFWSSSGAKAPVQPFSAIQQERLRAAKSVSGSVESGNPIAQILREILSPDCQSFLLFPWQVHHKVVTVIFSFAAPVPVFRRVPDRIAESLDLVGLATWSVKEIVRLHTELKTVNSRLAGRKLVERAKGVLQVEQGLTEERAYEYMRGVSRKRRITLTQLAEEVLKRRAANIPIRFSA
jgi:hypothetical protein